MTRTYTRGKVEEYCTIFAQHNTNEANFQVNIGHLLDIGRQLCDVLIHLESYIPPREQQEGDDLE